MELEQLRKAYDVLSELRNQTKKEKVKKQWMLLLDGTCESLAMEIRNWQIKLNQKKDIIIKNNNMITLVEWAKRNGMNTATARKYANLKKIPAEKIGRDWMIDVEAEPVNYKAYNKKK